ncbi:actin-like ATPase domain-containing protein [Athelia psychrophila]|uniref:Actin-like ATPase domain-containing protein n=1 Tax=Athelia psychrophila TaxID=1759441 RepID=A0A166UP60_9AGAM|nr:actin-like ATPase domain-containing protein [Fibularhizoctonia sp. CBS 109695]KZP31887.1 actin-like ATPase domain-containing protein [Fibularhizoctonia sp. CBS 109695]
MAPKSKLNGSSKAPKEVTNSFAPVVGINLGNSFASIAVLTKEGLAECIANEDGERQIACAVAFHGEEIYIGSQAKHQLVKNSANTITGFRNLLGRKFSEIPQDKPTNSAPLIQHPTNADEPAYIVKILQPAPLPLPKTAHNTPAASAAASAAATPRSEPIPATRTITVSEVTTLFIKSLLRSAEDFLGKKVDGAVISVPSFFDEAQRTALIAAAEAAGVTVLQLLEEAGAVAVTTTDQAAPELANDRTQLMVDLGASSLELSLISLREGLAYSLATLSDPTVGGDVIDTKLIKYFAKEFTKKSKIPLTVGPATDALDKRAEAKLLLAVEHTKRTLSASPGAATCSAEALKEGVDYTGSINRMRFDLEARPIYNQVYDKVREIVAGAGLDLYDVDEIVYVGGSACLPGLDETLAQGFAASVYTPFAAGTVVGGGIGDPTTILARGCALQAQLLASLTHEEEQAAFAPGSSRMDVKVTSRTVGVLFPGEGALGGEWIAVLPKDTALPTRRTIGFSVQLSDAKKVGLEIWEVKEGVKVEHVAPPKVDLGDEEEEEEEEEDVKEKTVEKEAVLGALTLEAQAAVQAKGRWKTKLELQFVAGADGDVTVSVWEAGKSENKVTTSIAAP